MEKASQGVTRCSWVTGDKVYQDYHDMEWGIEVRDERRLFEFLVLEGMQAGLSWLTILRKREAFRRAFDDFDPQTVASYDQRKVDELLGDSSIVRNRLKIAAAINNAHRFLEVQREWGSFHRFLWHFVDGRPIVTCVEDARQLPSFTALSQRISKALKARGFAFVGPTIVYSYLQAVGVVVDHEKNCWKCNLPSQNLSP